MKKFFVILVCKTIRLIGRLTGRGSSLPGQIALKLDPDILSKIKMPPYIVAVTGSNGNNPNLVSNVANGNGTSTATFTASNITANTVITVNVGVAPATPAVLTITNNSTYSVAINGVAAAGTYNANVGDVLTLTATGNVTVTGDTNVTAVMNGNMQTWKITVNGAGTITIA